ncbi:hypothetical protein [Bacillus kexueae]|uniref:hypothetical protein n=1 Tax=Aeribacillus kexueae TaxID=2078952 RepID=UPI001FAEB11A|nr:hypothetical protein [Bacillus kexueae]
MEQKIRFGNSFITIKRTLMTVRSLLCKRSILTVVIKWGFAHGVVHKTLGAN